MRSAKPGNHLKLRDYITIRNADKRLPYVLLSVLYLESRFLRTIKKKCFIF